MPSAPATAWGGSCGHQVRRREAGGVRPDRGRSCRVAGSSVLELLKLLGNPLRRPVAHVGGGGRAAAARRLIMTRTSRPVNGRPVSLSPPPGPPVHALAEQRAFPRRLESGGLNSRAAPGRSGSRPRAPRPRALVGSRRTGEQAELSSHGVAACALGNVARIGRGNRPAVNRGRQGCYAGHRGSDPRPPTPWSKFAEFSRLRGWCGGGGILELPSPLEKFVDSSTPAGKEQSGQYF